MTARSRHLLDPLRRGRAHRAAGRRARGDDGHHHRPTRAAGSRANRRASIARGPARRPSPRAPRSPPIPAPDYAFGDPNDNGAPGNKDGWITFAGDYCAIPPGQPQVCTLPGDEDTEITAHFRPAAQLDVVPSGRGSVTATIPAAGAGERASQTCNGDPQGGVSCEYTYLPGRQVTLVASPDTNEGPSSFVRWSDERCPAGPVCTLTMDAARQSIVALFTPQRVSVQVRGDRAGDEHAGRPRLPGRRRP